LRALFAPSFSQRILSPPSLPPSLPPFAGTGKKAPSLSQTHTAATRQAQREHETHLFLKEKEMMLTPLNPTALLQGGGGGGGKGGGRAGGKGAEEVGALLLWWMMMTNAGK